MVVVGYDDGGLRTLPSRQRSASRIPSAAASSGFAAIRARAVNAIRDYDVRCQGPRPRRRGSFPAAISRS